MSKAILKGFIKPPKSGRKKKPKGPKPPTPDQIAGAKEAGVGIRAFKKLPPNEQNKWIEKAKKAPVPKKPAKVVRSPRENAELKRLISSQKRDDAPDSDPLPRRRATGPEGFKPVEQGPLLSKVQLPEKMSKAQARKLIMQGKAKVRIDKNGKKRLVPTGEYAPAPSVIAADLGLIGKGKLPTEEELVKRGGFEIRQKGGTVKRRMGGVIKKGFGKATHGY